MVPHVYRDHGCLGFLALKYHPKNQLNIHFIQTLVWPKKTGRACANVVSILTGATKSRFSHICSSVMPYPNDTKVTVELASMQGKPNQKVR